LQRRDFSREDIHELRTAYRLMFAPEGTMSERIDDVVAMYAENSLIMEIVDFIRTETSRAVLQPKSADDG
jgi:UDP-N-acetylglucosamine acyltransferase